jgi:hypothetical protein
MEFSVIEQQLRPKYFKSQVNKSMQYVGISPQAYHLILPHIDVI